jgi:uncharacterized protein YwqG
MDKKCIYKPKKNISDPIFDLLVKYRYNEIKHDIPDVIGYNYNKLLVLCECNFELYEAFVFQQIKNNSDSIIDDMRIMKILFQFAPDKYKTSTFQSVIRALNHAKEKMQNNLNADPFCSIYQGLWAEGVTVFLCWAIEAFNVQILPMVEEFVNTFSIHSLKLSKTIVKELGEKGIRILCSTLKATTTYSTEKEFADTINLLSQLDISNYTSDVWNLLHIKQAKQKKMLINYFVGRKEQTIIEAVEILRNSSQEELKKEVQQILSNFRDSEEAVNALKTQCKFDIVKPKYSFDALINALNKSDKWSDVLEQEEDKKWIINNLRGEVNLINASYNTQEKIKLGQSKIGGLPHLPKGVKWPEYNNYPLSFLAQINLADINSDFENVLPLKGMLCFFIAASHKMDWDKDFRTEYKVIFNQAPMDKFDFIDAPVSLTEKELFAEQPLFFSNKPAINITKNICEYDEVTELVSEVLDGFDMNESQQIKTENIDNEAYSFIQGKLLGAADNRQDYVEEEWGDDYRLLFQCNGEDVGWGGDMMIYFGITEDDLKNKNFSRVKLTLQGT